MKKLLFIIAVAFSLTANAQNYLISFTGKGASTNVTTVKVENLTKGTTLTINGSDILRLVEVTGIKSFPDIQSPELKIYPNPMTDNATFEIFPPVAGNAVISVYEIAGKPIAQIQSNLENSRQDFRISCIKNGLYIINVKGNNYQFSGILLSNDKSNGTIRIEKVNSIIQTFDEKEEITDRKGTFATVDMAYTIGDRLKFTGISGNYSTIKTDVPTSDKTITFNLIACTDADNNNYPVVEIGTQVWMTENLKTTKFNDATDIPIVTEGASWAALSTPGYSWYNNDEAANKATYGALYNWYAVNAVTNGGKNVCPTGWHVPTDADWTIFTDYLINNNFGYQGRGKGIAKSMATKSGWTPYSVAGTTGNDQASNNRSGFSVLPGGYHSYNGNYGLIGYYGYLWSSSEYSSSDSWYRGLEYNYNAIVWSYINKGNGHTVRSLRD